MNFLKRFFSNEPKTPRIDIKKRFELIGRVGQGSMSKVWRARDFNSGRIIALKVLDKQKTLDLESRFVGLNKPKEGEIAVQLNHPHIVQTFEHGLTTDNEQFLVMEFIEGYSLSYMVDAQNENMRTNCLKYIIQLGEAINYFHEENWIHRDICPRNIIVGNNQELKLIDFGLVVPNTTPFLVPGNRTGTAAYMAPELIKRQKTSQKIDIFSYAVTCYEMLTKRLPWKAAETLDAVLQHINTPPDPIHKLLPNINPQLADTIMKGLELYPQDRWNSVADMLEPLKQVYQENNESTQKVSENTVVDSSDQSTHTISRSKTKPRRRKSTSNQSKKREAKTRQSDHALKSSDSSILKKKDSSHEIDTTTIPPPQDKKRDSSLNVDHPSKKKPSSKKIKKNPDETI